MMNRLTRALLLVAVATAAFAGQPPPAQPAAPPLTIQAIQARIKTLEAATDVAKEERDAALKLYRDAVVGLEAQTQHAAEAQGFEALRRGSPALLQTMEARRTELTAVPEPTVPDDATLETLQVALEKARADLKASAEHLARLKAEAIERQGRRKKLPDLIRAAKDLLRQHEQQQAILP
ncbi:hypothetical protein HQ576_04320, partial [bacterium]|nr:hypothetical protein [bacterium]